MNQPTAGSTPKAKKFWDRIADKYSSQTISDMPSYEKKLEVTRRYFTPDSQVFEFGCGTGSTALLHAQHVKHIHAVDFSQRMIEIARTKADEEGISNVSFESASIEDIDSSSKHYDVVLGLNVLHLLDDRQAAIKKVYELIEPGGVFVSSTACIRDSVLMFLAPLLWLGQLVGRVPTVKFFTMKNLLKDLKQAGFEIEYQWRPGNGFSSFIVARKPMS